MRTSSYGAWCSLAAANSSCSLSTVSAFISFVICRMCCTACTTSPVPASPLVRIIAAPSAIRRRASPKFRAPHTNGVVKACLSMWCASSAGVSTSLSSIKSTPSSCRICASAKCPMRAFAITGIETVSMIALISFGFAIRATPPSARIIAGTRSSAITETAPASSAIRACSTFITSMMTPPFSISASPTFSRSVVGELGAWWPLPL